MTSSVHLLSRGRAFVTFHIKYYFIENKRDGKFIIIIYLSNQMLQISVKQIDGNVVLRPSDCISSCKHSTFMK